MSICLYVGIGKSFKFTTRELKMLFWLSLNTKQVHQNTDVHSVIVKCLHCIHPLWRTWHYTYTTPYTSIPLLCWNALLQHLEWESYFHSNPLRSVHITLVFLVYFWSPMKMVLFAWHTWPMFWDVFVALSCFCNAEHKCQPVLKLNTFLTMITTIPLQKFIGIYINVT